MLNRCVIVATFAAVMFCTSVSDALAVPFQPGEFITYTDESWGGTPAPGNVAQLLLAGFDTVYTGGLEVGISGGAGFSMLFTSGPHLLDYLPHGGPGNVLTMDLVDPTSAAGIFGSYTVALQLNVDFNDGGFITGSSNSLFGDLILNNLANYTDFNGLSVRQFLAHINVRMGGGTSPFTDDELTALAQDLTRAFEGGTPTQFAQDHLILPDTDTVPVPEPGTLSLLWIWNAPAATLTHRGSRWACKQGRQAGAAHGP